MRRLVLTLLLIAAAMLTSNSTAAEKTRDFEARAVRVLKGSAIMHYEKKKWLSNVTGSVGTKGIPKVIRLGDTVKVKDRSLK